MFIPFEFLKKTYNINPIGVFHVGANMAQEAEEYRNGGVIRTIWIEAIPDIYNILVANLSASYQNWKAFNECVSDVDGQIVDFRITDNEGASSSMLEFAKVLDKDHYPQINIVRTIKCVTKKLDTLILENKIDVGEYDFLCMDLQGAELLALKGMKDNLHKVNFAYLEVNRDELYTNCARVEQIDEFLLEYGFTRKETYWDGKGWGEAFYIKQIQ